MPVPPSRRTLPGIPAGSLRVEPQQARARETVEQLLACAVRILASEGGDALTTSALAEAADVRVRTVYRYFPNRQAVLAAVAERLAAEQESVLGDFPRIADPGTPWDRAVKETVEEFVAAASVQPAQAAVRAAMRTAPELRSIDEALDARVADRLAAALRRRGARAPRARLDLAAATFVAAATAILERAALDPSGDGDAATAELVRLGEHYLGSYLPGAD